MSDAAERQREYYKRTASEYDTLHVEEEHVRALLLLGAFIEMHQIRSVLDIGAGTGRAMSWLKHRFPDLVVKGVEPVEELRNVGFDKGISPEDLVAGDGASLPFADDSFDLVCEFAVLHHVRQPDQVVQEMSRVAARMVAISDCNFMGQGSWQLRRLKRLVYSAGLWPLADWIKTRGKRYTYSEGDGIAYSYSVFQSLPVLRRRWNKLQIISTGGASDTERGIMSTAAHLLVVSTGKQS